MQHQRVVDRAKAEERVLKENLSKIIEEDSGGLRDPKDRFKVDMIAEFIMESMGAKSIEDAEKVFRMMKMEAHQMDTVYAAGLDRIFYLTMQQKAKFDQVEPGT